MTAVNDRTTVRSYFENSTIFFTTSDGRASTVVECTTIQLENTSTCLEPGSGVNLLECTTGINLQDVTIT